MRNNFIILQLVLALTLLVTGIAQAQHTLHCAQSPDQTAPCDADPMNITLVVETGDHHISVLNGDTFKVIARFATPFAVQGPLQFSPDGRYVFILSRNGWVQKYDLWSLKQVGRVRAGLNTRNIVISADGLWLAVANNLPAALTILSTGDLSPATVHEVPGGVSGVYHSASRKSFVLALNDLPKIWEVFYGPNPPAMGFAHDWRSEGPVPQSTPFPIRKITTPDLLEDFALDPSGEYVIATAQHSNGGMVIDLVIDHKVAKFDLPGTARLGAGVIWKRGNTHVMAIPHPEDAVVSVIEMNTWKMVDRITTDAPGLFASSHENSKYIWVGVSFGPNKDGVQVIDKQTLEIVKTLRLTSGASVAHVGFTKTGSHALMSVRQDGGAVIIYDAETLKEVTRLQMRNPSGSYNVTHCIRLCSGALGLTP